MSEKTKKQHYVWEFYLKGWATDDQIWCKRTGKLFKTSTENVAQERYFYEIEPLSHTELDLLKSMVMRGPEINQITNLSSLCTYLEIAHAKGDVSRYGIEWFHSMIEGKALPVLTELRSGNAKILEDRQSKIDLCIYLGHQYTRTKRARNSFSATHEDLNTPEKYRDCDLGKIHNAMAFIIANAIGSSICDHLDLQLIKNNTGVRLITSDQPIYNFLAISGEAPNETSIYFPISPELALWSKKNPNNERIDTKDKAEELNAFMARNSLECIFAENEEDLLKF